MRTLRARLFSYLALAVLCSTALTVAVAALLTQNQVRGQALASLDRQAQAVATTVGQLGAPQFSPQMRVFVVSAGSIRRAPVRTEQAVDTAIAGSGQGEGTVDVGARQMLFAVRQTEAGPIALVRSARLQVGDWRPFVGSLLLAGLAGAAIAALLSFLLARRLARPLHEVSVATRKVAQGSVDTRVPVHGSDELAVLASSFNDMANELARAKQAERAFLMSVSHELKTPLSAIRGYAEALEDHVTDSDQAAAVIRGESDRLENLVCDLLDLARLDRHEFTVTSERVDLGTIADEVLERYKPRARELAIELQSTACEPTPVCGDHQRTLQAVSNLVENALRYTPQGGRVRIEVACGQIAVADSGPGLAGDDLPYVFDRFYLYNKYRLDRPVGSGLGLAIVKELVEMMRGTVTVDSQPGAGATFTVSLPPWHEPDGKATRLAPRANGARA